MLLPAILSLTFASSSGVSASDDDSARDTAQQAQASAPATTATKPRVALTTPPVGPWDEVLSVLRQVHGGELPRAPICIAAQEEGYWVEVFTKSGEWRAASRPCASAAAALTTAPPLAELKGLHSRQLLSCDVVKPWVESARAPKDTALFITTSTSLVSIQPVSGGR